MNPLAINNISALTHPSYSASTEDWRKWRLTYESGEAFLDEYLKKFNEREGSADFQTRKDISYVPAFAKSAVNNVKDAIYQRIADVTRDGSKSYNNAIIGKDGGIDKAGTTINSFIGSDILPELLTMSKVGVFIDMPVNLGETQIEQQGKTPYIYQYKAEDIINWEVDLQNNKQFTKLLLRDFIFQMDENSGLPTDVEERYRFLALEENVVLVHFFDKDSNYIETRDLNLKEIPFALFEITDSLLRDIANYQISLLNLASSDMAYALNCNFPFYVEQYDPRVDNLYQRQASSSSGDVEIVTAGEREDSIAAKNKVIEVGTMTGRKIPKGLELPRYIHPSSEPLKASMSKQKELKDDINRLVKLAVSNLAADASAESKSFDERSLEAGLSAIGLELEQGERRIAQLWQMYESDQNEVTIKYPKKYSLQTDREQREEANDLADSVKNIPSLLYKREAMKIAVSKRLGSKISSDSLEKIHTEIDNANVIFHNPEELSRDVELTLIDPETASEAKGYPKGAVEKAKIAHADRVQRIAESQAKARGASDLGGLENASREEKMGKDEEIVASDKTRGSDK